MANRLLVLLGLLAPLALGPGCGGDDDGDAPDAAPPDSEIVDAGAPIDALVIDALVIDASPPDAMRLMSITSITPPAASRYLDTTVTITGGLLASGATVTITNCDTGTVIPLVNVVVAADGYSLTADLPADAAREQGLYTVTVTNPDGQSDTLECAFRVLAQMPPTVTSVVPASAYAGVPGDGVLSDQSVQLEGTGFEPGAIVRWDRTDGTASYEASLVGFVSSVELTAIAPSETLHMTAGAYHVWVINPDFLAGQWLVDDGTGTNTLIPGIFTITASAPPAITNVDPGRIFQGACGGFTIFGSNFDPAAQAYYLAPAGTNCAGGVPDANGNVLCPLVVSSINAEGTEIAAAFAACNTGAWPIVVVNPDGQADYYYSVSVTNSSDNHLNNDAFAEIPGVSLITPRWKHAATYGFDVYSNAYLYVAGGQDGAGQVLDSVETSQVTIFGTPGPFEIKEQYFGATPDLVRAPNALSTKRQGATMVRVGTDLFVIGGADAATDTTTPVTALSTAERAHILGYDEMPGIHLPTSQGGAGLPVGTWYYRVAALGEWGEGLPTREVAAHNVGGQIQVCWDAPAVTGTAGYNVYRSLAADGRSSSSVLLAVNVAETCFLDDGVGDLTPAPANLRGAPTVGTALVAGVYSYRVAALGAWGETHAGYASTIELTADDVAAGNAAIQLYWDAIDGATGYRVYRLDDVTGEYLQLDTGDVLSPELLDDGALLTDPAVTPIVEVAPLTAGSLSRWTPIAPALLSPREGLDGVLVAMEVDETQPSPQLVGRIVVAGGRSDNTTSASYLTSAESIGVYDDGSLDASWYLEAPVFNFARAYFALLTTQDRNVTPFPPSPPPPPCGDVDGDGYIDCACAPDDATNKDCNDADATVHPGATEICGDGVDQDCDLGCAGIDLPCGSCDAVTNDRDTDGHLSLADSCGDDCCDSGSETSLGCNVDTRGSIYAGAPETCGNGIDEDCDGLDQPCDCTTDDDADGVLSAAAGCGADCCDSGSENSLGCTPTTAAGIFPGATERCGDGIDSDCDGHDGICKVSAGLPIALDSTEPVYLIAIMGDDTFQASNNSGLGTFETCLVGDDGHLACDGDADAAVTTWVLEPEDNVHATFANDAVLYFDAMYPFYAIASETVTAALPSTRSLIASGMQRYNLLLPEVLPPAVDLTIVSSPQGAGGAQFFAKRAYYQMVRMMAYIYVVGGWTDASVPPGPTGAIERHMQ